MSNHTASGRLVELAVTDLGIIDHLRLHLGPGMTALTGETGAGKTMVVGAIDLLLGGRADSTVVRPGAKEAVVEGRFVINGDELVLTRVIPAEGRSRAYVDGRMATAAILAERTSPLVDLHGQHTHQSLLAGSVQRAALDEFANVDLGPLINSIAERRRLTEELASLGGDPGARAREIDLLRYQVAELDAADISDPDEDASLSNLEDCLADALAHQEAAALAGEVLSGDGGVADKIGTALAALGTRAPFGALAERLRGLHEDLIDVAADVRDTGERIEDDPQRLAVVRSRRQLLVELRRKYATAPMADGHVGGGALADVVAYRNQARRQLELLESHDSRAEAVDRRLLQAVAAEATEAKVVGAARRSSAPQLARAVEAHLAELAMPRAKLVVAVGDTDPGDTVTFLLAANPGLPPGPLARVASGGELARTMLALRLVLKEAPPILVFDEVDAGIGGDAAVSVGRALAALGHDHQVLVVTHLPQ
ncbi:MAG: DNA repair protein RecN, partial [Aquihabitans sp.]